MSPFFSTPIGKVIRVVLLASLVTATCVEAKKSVRVVVDARAGAEFSSLKEKHPDGLTYTVMKGTYFKGTIQDKSLDEISFNTVAREIAERLKQRGMFLAAEKKNADMLLVISWGTTETPLDWSELLGEEDDVEDIEDGEGFDDLESTSSENLGTDQFDENVARAEEFSTAKLIGIQRALRTTSRMDPTYQDLRELLNSERYFIVVSAFDFQKLKNEKELSPLWSTRFSLDSTGVGFDDAYLSLARAAAPYFGENLDDLAKSRVHLGTGEATVGEVEVIGLIEGEGTEDEE